MIDLCFVNEISLCMYHQGYYDDILLDMLEGDKYYLCLASLRAYNFCIKGKHMLKKAYVKKIRRQKNE